MRGARRGSILPGLLLVLATLAAAVLAATSAWGDDASTDAVRAEGLRARYAAEGAAAVAARLLGEGEALPTGEVPVDAAVATLSAGAESGGVVPIEVEATSGYTTVIVEFSLIP